MKMKKVRSSQEAKANLRTWMRMRKDQARERSLKRKAMTRLRHLMRMRAK